MTFKYWLIRIHSSKKLQNHKFNFNFHFIANLWRKALMARYRFTDYNVNKNEYKTVKKKIVKLCILNHFNLYNNFNNTLNNDYMYELLIHGWYMVHLRNKRNENKTKKFHFLIQDVRSNSHNNYPYVGKTTNYNRFVYVNG